MYLSFSDSAKFYEAAKNLITGNGLVIHHSFFSSSALVSYYPGQSWPTGFLPLTSFILSIAFKLLPANDLTIAAVGFLLFAFCIGLVFLIAKKLHSARAGIVSALLFSSSLFFFEYAQNASTEIFFTTEILLFTYLALQKNKPRWLAIIPLLLMFITRQQAILFLLALPTYFICFGLKNWRHRLLSVIVIVLFFFGLYSLAKKDVSSIYSPLKPFYAVQMAAGVSQGLYLRGQTYSATPITLKDFAIKVVYNLYNFAKSPDRLAPTAIFLLYLFSFFTSKHRQFTFYTASVFLLFLLGASASLPNARYVHPVIPLVVISASPTLIQLLEKFSPRRFYLKLTAVLVFLTLPTIGFFTLDARFRRQQYNIDKPPVYRQISSLMAETIPKGKLIITNLDAWAAWYEGLTTMWFPLSPDLLSGHQDKVSYIVITNYKEHDGDFALGDWREVVYSPEKIGNQFLKTNYRLLTTFEIKPEQVYENQSYLGTILVRR